jgi:hypothetical protein
MVADTRDRLPRGAKNLSLSLSLARSLALACSPLALTIFFSVSAGCVSVSVSVSLSSSLAPLPPAPSLPPSLSGSVLAIKGARESWLRPRHHRPKLSEKVGHISHAKSLVGATASGAVASFACVFGGSAQTLFGGISAAPAFFSGCCSQRHIPLPRRRISDERKK